MATTNTYLNFNGNCEEAFTLYKAVFGGEFTYIGKFSEMPPSEDYETPTEDLDKIMHVSLPIGDSILMGSDTGSAYADNFILGNNFSIAVNPSSIEEADRIFNGLAVGGRVTMPLSKTFFSTYFGMLTDRFGVNWMIDMGEG